MSREFRPGDVLQVQLGSRMVRGLISPFITALFLDPGCCICLEHRRDPVGCFSAYSEVDIPDLQDRNMMDYKKTMSDVLSMSSAADAIRQYTNTFINNVRIKWSHSHDVFTGVLTLRKSFCKERSIRFYQKHDLTDDDYLCVQFHNVRREKVRGRGNPASQSLIEESFSWFGHCVITKIEEVKHFSEDMVRVHLKLKQNEFHLLRLLREAGQNSDNLHWCVEIIRKPIPERRCEDAVRQIDETPGFIQNILMGKPISRDADPVQAKISKETDALLAEMEEKWTKEEGSLWKKGELKKLPWWNKEQKRVVKVALQQRWTLIQGPPGTGKSNVAAYIASAFVLMNNRKKSFIGGKKVLVCAPSNKAADVFSGYLKKFDLKVIRMYSKSIEGKDYPVPGWSTCTSERHSGSDHSESARHHDDIALHHVIRNQPKNDMSRNLCRLDKMFRDKTHEYRKRKKKYVVSKSVYKEYRDLEEKLQKAELTKCDVIVCTCSEAASERIRTLDIEQCIVDEAGMCTEPETLTPFKSAKLKKVVLIGDHLQLQAIVTHEQSKQRGLAISLFERCCRHNKYEQLVIQYRMHEKLCEFPSNQFYEGRLKTAEEVKKRKSEPKVDSMWPRNGDGQIYPMLFCNVVGVEETLQVTTEEGNEQSKKNVRESEEVVRIVMGMVKHRNIRESRIQVLSQYRSQLSDLETKLKQAGLQDVQVNSVIGFQGSEKDYIVLSTVRSLPLVEIEEKPNTSWLKRNLGFIRDEHQINVALTRARKGLIIIGNEKLLRTDKILNSLIEDYAAKGCLYQEEQFSP